MAFIIWKFVRRIENAPNRLFRGYILFREMNSGIAGSPPPLFCFINSCFAFGAINNFGNKLEASIHL
jgi:hypothetical protein